MLPQLQLLPGPAVSFGCLRRLAGPAVPRPKPQIDLATQARHKVVMEALESRSQIFLIT